MVRIMVRTFGKTETLKACHIFICKQCSIKCFNGVLTECAAKKLCGNTEPHGTQAVYDGLKARMMLDV